MGFGRSIATTAKGLFSLLVGLKVTGRNFTQSQLTVHYPRATVSNLTTYRGHIELTPKTEKENGHSCIACGTCARTCPADCITVVMEAPPINREPEVNVVVDRAVPAARQEPPRGAVYFKKPASFTLDYTKCSLCGLCVESCPTNAIHFSNDIYIAAHHQAEYHYDLLARLQAQSVDGPTGKAAPVHNTAREERI